MKKTILVIALAAILLFSGCSLLGPTTFENDCYSIELPSGFYEEEEGVYYRENPEMYIETFFYPNEMDLDIALISDLIMYTEFYEGDILDVDGVEIDGSDAIQAEYELITDGLDGNEYYYFGILTFIKLDEEILVVDTYIAMDVDDGMESVMPADTREEIEAFTATIKVLDEGYSEYDISGAGYLADINTLNLSDNWFEAVEGENGMYDIGYYALYENVDLYMYYEFYRYNDANTNDLDDVAADAESLPEYSFAGNTTIAGEAADVYKYEALEDGEGAYYYGVVAVSEHYWVDGYFLSYNDDYEFSQDTIDNILDYITNID